MGEAVKEMWVTSSSAFRLGGKREGKKAANNESMREQLCHCPFVLHSVTRTDPFRSILRLTGQSHRQACLQMKRLIPLNSTLITEAFDATHLYNIECLSTWLFSFAPKHQISQEDISPILKALSCPCQAKS